MVIDRNDQEAIVTIVNEVEAVASRMNEHSSERATLYRNAAALRQLLKKSVVTSTHRGKPVKG